MIILHTNTPIDDCIFIQFGFVVEKSNLDVSTFRVFLIKYKIIIKFHNL